jgi:hypothetical protein
VLGALSVLSLAGWLIYARDAIQQKLGSNIRLIFVLFSAFWFLLLISHVRFSLAILGTDQGRQLFVGLPLLALLLVIGLSRLLGKSAAIVWGGGLFVLTFAVIFYLHQVYSPPVSAPVSNISQGRLAPVDFGETIRVNDYRIERTRVAPGGFVNVEFYWQALNDPSENYWLLLQLVGKGEVVARRDGVPSAGRFTTDWWQAGQGFVSRHSLLVPADLAPGTYALQLGLHPFGRWEWLSVRGQDVLTLGSILVTLTPDQP